MLICFPIGKLSPEVKDIISDKITEYLERGYDLKVSSRKEPVLIKWIPNDIIPGTSPLFFQKENAHLNDNGIHSWIEHVKEKLKSDIDEYISSKLLDLKLPKWTIYMTATSALRVGVDKNSAGRISAISFG
jgi:hypothetical protein